jgi:hypothetical protein
MSIVLDVEGETDADELDGILTAPAKYECSHCGQLYTVRELADRCCWEDK